MSILYVIRGLPGCGKSTYAKTLNVFHLEADAYCMRDSKYQWKPETVKRSHEFIQSLARQIMNEGSDLVVSNTFTTHKEMTPYIEMANEFGYKIKVISCKGNFGNTHDVPEETLVKMAERWMPFDGEEIYIPVVRS